MDMCEGLKAQRGAGQIGAASAWGVSEGVKKSPEPLWLWGSERGAAVGLGPTRYRYQRMLLELFY